MKKIILFLGSLSTLAWVLFAVSACSQQPQQTANGVEVSDGGGSGLVQEITLKDGTHCAVLIGYSKAAMSCGWKRE